MSTDQYPQVGNTLSGTLNVAEYISERYSLHMRHLISGVQSDYLLEERYLGGNFIKNFGTCSFDIYETKILMTVSHNIRS